MIKDRLYRSCVYWVIFYIGLFFFGVLSTHHTLKQNHTHPSLTFLIGIILPRSISATLLPIPAFPAHFHGFARVSFVAVYVFVHLCSFSRIVFCGISFHGKPTTIITDDFPGCFVIIFWGIIYRQIIPTGSTFHLYSFL